MIPTSTRLNTVEKIAECLKGRIMELRTYRLARNSYVPAIIHELQQVLCRMGYATHAGTWISPEEQDRISKDGP